MSVTKKITIYFIVLSFFLFFVSGSHAAEKKFERKSNQININTAGVDQLSKLPGIGVKKAKRIIEYRKKHGRFRRIQNIMKVKGIGEKTFKKFAKRIRV